MLPSLGGYKGPLDPLTKMELAIKADLFEIVTYLAGALGERNLVHTINNLDASSDYIYQHFAQAGLKVSEQIYSVNDFSLKNIIGEKIGTHQDEVIVVGAHYDTVPGSPGADDNASGIASIIAIAKLIKKIPCKATIRFVAFCTEESPYFYTHQMGSWHYAKMLKENHENIKGMFSIESIGYYSIEKNSQRYPFFLGALYPNQGDFIAFVANLASSKFLSNALSTFRRKIRFPSEGIAAPTIIPGVSWSDQLSFWRMGYKAIMVTDTAPYRNPNYHTKYDLPDTLDYDRMAKVVHGLMLMIDDLANKT